MNPLLRRQIKEDEAWAAVEATAEWKDFCSARRDWGLLVKELMESELGRLCDVACKKQSKCLSVLSETTEAKRFVKVAKLKCVDVMAIFKFANWEQLQYPEEYEALSSSG